MMPKNKFFLFAISYILIAIFTNLNSEEETFYSSDKIISIKNML